MKTLKALAVSVLMMVGVVGVADAASRVSSSSRSSFSSSRSYSAPKSYSAPRATVSSSASKPTLKSLGFSKPATTTSGTSAFTRTAPAPRVTEPSSRPSTATSGGWFSRKTVSSAPAPTYRAPVRKVSSPVAYRSQPQRNVTVIQRNYYGGNSGYNRGYGGGYHVGGYGYRNSSMGDAFVGTVGGMMVYNALTSNHSSGNASSAQIEAAKQDQRIEDKLDRVLDQQQAPVTPVVVAQAPVVQAQQPQQPQCAFPDDAPLMMAPSFYCQPQNNR